MTGAFMLMRRTQVVWNLITPAYSQFQKAWSFGLPNRTPDGGIIIPVSDYDGGGAINSVLVFDGAGIPAAAYTTTAAWPNRNYYVRSAIKTSDNAKIITTAQINLPIGSGYQAAIRAAIAPNFDTWSNIPSAQNCGLTLASAGSEVLAAGYDVTNAVYVIKVSTDNGATFTNVLPPTNVAGLQPMKLFRAGSLYVLVSHTWDASGAVATLHVHKANALDGASWEPVASFYDYFAMDVSADPDTSKLLLTGLYHWVTNPVSKQGFALFLDLTSGLSVGYETGVGYQGISGDLRGTTGLFGGDDSSASGGSGLLRITHDAGVTWHDYLPDFPEELKFMMVRRLDSGRWLVAGLLRDGSRSMRYYLSSGPL